MTVCTGVTEERNKGHPGPPDRNHGSDVNVDGTEDRVPVQVDVVLCFRGVLGVGLVVVGRPDWRDTSPVYTRFTCECVCVYVHVCV